MKEREINKDEKLSKKKSINEEKGKENGERNKMSKKKNNDVNCSWRKFCYFKNIVYAGMKKS